MSLPSAGTVCPPGAGGRAPGREGAGAVCASGLTASGGERWPRARRASCLKLRAHLEARRAPAEQLGRGNGAEGDLRGARGPLGSDERCVGCGLHASAVTGEGPRAQAK